MKKDKKQILSEELKKFNKLLGYDYYDKRDNVNEDFHFHKPGILDPHKSDLLFGSMKEAEEDEVPEADEEVPGMALPPAEEAPAEAPLDAPMPEEEPTADMSGEVELDVTELVKGSQDAKASADEANNKIEQLMGMVDKLENQLTSMKQISDKIDKLEFELEKRAPTPEEKIQLRSLDSYPFNIKLTDFWADKTGQYDVLNAGEEKEKEYELTQSDVDSDYSDETIKNTFDTTEYEEEDI